MRTLTKWILISLMTPGIFLASVGSARLAFSDEVIPVVPFGEAEIHAEDPSAMAVPGTTSEPLIKAVITLRIINPQVAADKVRILMGSAAGGVIVDQKAHSLEITAPAKILTKIQSLIADIDQEREIAFDIKVVQVVLNEENFPGINWSAIVSDYKSFIANDDNRKFSVGSVSDEDLPILLEALETVGDTRISSDHKAHITVGEDADLRLKAFEGNVSVNVSPVSVNNEGQEQQDRYTARLILRPTVTGDHRVDLQILTSQGSSINLTIAEDEVAVIGGIFTQSKSESTKKFPFLGDVPLLGIVFRDQSQVTQRLENILIVTPRVTASITKP